MSTISASTTSTTAFKITTDTTGALVFQTGASPTTAVTIDGSQNVGVGVTPSAWSSSWRAIQLGGGGSLVTWASDAGTNLSANAYNDGSWKRINAATAAQYSLTSTGEHRWNIAGSSTAGSTISFTQAMTLDASGNLGLRITPSGWSSATPAFQIGAFGVVTAHTSANYCNVGTNYYFNGSNNVYIGTGSATLYSQNSGAHAWYVAGSGTAGNTVSFSQSMTLDSSGRLGIGTTSPAEILHVVSPTTQAKFEGANQGNIIVAKTGSTGFSIYQNAAGKLGFYDNTNASDRMIIETSGNFTFPFGWLNKFLDASTPCLGIGTSNTGFMFIGDAADRRIIPRTQAGGGADNTINFGDAGSRYKTIYATTGTINTSDAREKTPVTPLTAEELTAAAQIAASVGTYQWLHAVEEKGAAARHHAGLTVQRAIEIMEANNLNPFDYGFICYDSWQGEEAGDRYSFRMDELSLFIARGQQAIIEQMQTRLTALEAK